MTFDQPTRPSTPSSEPAGCRLVLDFDRTTVPLEAIERALYALADEVTGTIEEDDRSWSLVAYARAAHADPTALTHRLRQEVNDQTLRVRIASRSDPIRDLIFALAYSRTGLVERSPGASDETAP